MMQMTSGTWARFGVWMVIGKWLSEEKRLLKGHNSTLFLLPFLKAVSEAIVGGLLGTSKLEECLLFHHFVSFPY